MYIKVCGMRQLPNIEEIARLSPDYMGFIFYPGSKRYVGESFKFDVSTLKQVGIKPVAVFVNASTETVKAVVHEFGFNVVQLHGNESPEYCKMLKETGVVVWKVFGVGSSFKPERTVLYKDVCDNFLFDTSSTDHGGTGKKFDWKTLQEVRFQKPFILSGGIAPDDVDAVKAFEHPDFAGIDINSRFELEPGLKDTSLVKNFIEKLRK